MKLEKINPWNWFKHEEDDANLSSGVPISRSETSAVSNPAGANPLARMHSEIDRMFDQAFRNFGFPMLGTGFPSAGEMPSFYRPQIDIEGDANRYEITLDVPGLSEKDMSIEVKGDLLLIKGQKEERSENKDKQYYRMERSYGAFQRTLSLPEDANADEIEASMDKGVLKLRIPRREVSKQDVKQISIKS